MSRFLAECCRIGARTSGARYRRVDYVSAVLDNPINWGFATDNLG